ELEILTGLNGTPALLKLHSVGFGQMSFRIALHVNNAKLDIGMREEAFCNRQQSAEVIMNDDHDATKATFNESSLNEFPILEIFTAWSCNTGEDLLFAVTVQPHDNVDASRPQFVTFTQLNIFTVEKQSQHIGMNWTAVSELEFLDQTGGHTFYILLGARQPHFLKRVFGGI